MIELLHIDCMEYMRTLPDKAFDLAIVDPPYGISLPKMKMGGRQTVVSDKTKNWDDCIPSNTYFSCLCRVSKNQIIFGGNYFFLPPSRCFVVWDKAETMYGRSFSECKYAWTSFQSSARIFKFSPVDLKRIHAAQKPVALYKFLLNNFAKKGDRILDTHLGSGSIACACHELGFDLVGCEIDADYFNAAKQRLENFQRQQLLKLGDEQ